LRQEEVEVITFLKKSLWSREGFNAMFCNGVCTGSSDEKTWWQ
jgi:hypothetical protein